VRVGRALTVAGRVVAMAMRPGRTGFMLMLFLRRAFMMAQGHADAGGDGRKALNGHGQRQKHDDQKLGQADGHRVVV